MRLVDWLWWGETNVSELRPHGLIVYPRLTAIWTMVWWYRLELTPNSSTRAFWQPPVLSGGPASRDISGASRRMDEANKNLVYPSPRDFKRSLTCRKMLWHVTSGFTSHPKEGVLRIFIALQNPSPWPDSNPGPLSPLVSTLTTTPPGDLHYQVSHWPLTTETLVCARNIPSGICGGQWVTGTDFSPSSSSSTANIIPPWLSTLMYRLRDDQYARWLPHSEKYSHPIKMNIGAGVAQSV
jgi:hypothetical protein